VGFVRFCCIRLLGRGFFLRVGFHLDLCVSFFVLSVVWAGGGSLMGGGVLCGVSAFRDGSRELAFFVSLCDKF